ncbi:CU044_5270 family protein [Nocardioides pantholopis]|uniref:CU044_5270 family protein n=1 Tax=Nocardioides pantholopis TaxID=2483798 RepID=UPI000FD93389|nr:CU044_5270 family protein [Nocardioides pantholopis]
MTDLDLLRRVRQDVTEPTAATLAPARATLLARATGGRPRPRRTRAALVAAAVVAAVAVTSLVVLTNPVTTPPAAAAQLLHRAADRAGDGPAPGPGQYLAVETRQDTLGYVQDDRANDGSVIGAYRSASVSTTYVPRDRDGTWVRRYWAEEPTEFYGGAAVRRAAARDFATQAQAGDPGLERADGGRFGNGELGGGSGGLEAADIETLPRDPRRLLARLQDAGGVGDSPQWAAIQSASTLLRTGLVPVGLRRALYQALALLPEVQILDDTLTMSGRRGTAVGVQVDGYTWSIVLDPDSGDFLGEVQTQLEATGAVPAGTVAYRTAVSVSVVEDIPEP